MPPSPPDPPAPSVDPQLLLTTADLVARGLGRERNGWHRVRRGVWMAIGPWSRLTPDQRHAAYVHATLRICARPERDVVLRDSAAALWGMPRISPWPPEVHLLLRGADGGDSRVLRRHPGRIEKICHVGGLRVSTPERTVIDLARSGALHDAVAAGDFALRRGLCSRDQLRAEAEAIDPGGRGRRVAAFVAAFVVEKSGSAGESLSRLQMYRLNVPEPRLQVPHQDSAGLIGVVDFEWARAGLARSVIGEFDGRLKYQVTEDMSPRQAGEVVWREKLREDRLRRQSDLCRWVWRDALELDKLAAILAGVGVLPRPRGPRSS